MSLTASTSDRSSSSSFSHGRIDGFSEHLTRVRLSCSGSSRVSWKTSFCLLYRADKTTCSPCQLYLLFLDLDHCSHSRLGDCVLRLHYARESVDRWNCVYGKFLCPIDPPALSDGLYRQLHCLACSGNHTTLLWLRPVIDIEHRAPLNVIPAWIVQVLQVSVTCYSGGNSYPFYTGVDWCRHEPYLHLPR